MSDSFFGLVGMVMMMLEQWFFLIGSVNPTSSQRPKKEQQRRKPEFNLHLKIKKKKWVVIENNRLWCRKSNVDASWADKQPDSN